MKVNAAALPSELLESELFGHERGAFTGAQTARIGKFEFANHGTLMLDEIGEMPAGLQAKLLHVLQDSEFTKLGSNRPVHGRRAHHRRDQPRSRGDDARRDSFREDLYYRLQVIELHVPPLRERREEIPQLIEFFLVKYSERYGRPLRRPSEPLRDALLNYAWPGNVRELENVIKRFVILQDEALVLAELKRARAHAESVIPPPGRGGGAGCARGTGRADGASGARSTCGAGRSRSLRTPRQAPRARCGCRRGRTGRRGRGRRRTGTAKRPRQPSRVGARSRDARGARRDSAGARSLPLEPPQGGRLLGVSYKTLLNKMKECGISEGATSA